MPSAEANKDQGPRTIWAGAGLAALAGVGATIGVLVAGGIGIALGAAIGAAMGLVLGAVVDMWAHRR